MADDDMKIYVENSGKKDRLHVKTRKKGRKIWKKRGLWQNWGGGRGGFRMVVG